MPRHALRSELAAKLSDGWTGAAGRHVLGSEMPGGSGLRHALDSEVQALTVGPAPTIPTFHGVAQARGFATTTVVGAVTGARVGDILVAFAGGNDQTTTLTPPAGQGWTQIADTSTPAAGRLRVLVTTATAADQAGGTWTWTATAHNHSVAVLAYTAAALPTAGGTARADAQLTITAPSRTSVAANALLLTYAYFTSNGTAPAWPGSMTVRSPNLAAASSGVGAEERLPAPGASGTRVFTAGGAPSFFTAASLILEPA